MKGVPVLCVKRGIKHLCNGEQYWVAVYGNSRTVQKWHVIVNIKYLLIKNPRYIILVL